MIKQSLTPKHFVKGKKPYRAKKKIKESKEIKFTPPDDYGDIEYGDFDDIDLNSHSGEKEYRSFPFPRRI